MFDEVELCLCNDRGFVSDRTSLQRTLFSQSQPCSSLNPSLLWFYPHLNTSPNPPASCSSNFPQQFPEIFTTNTIPSWPGLTVNPSWANWNSASYPTQLFSSDNNLGLERSLVLPLGKEPWFVLDLSPHLYILWGLSFFLRMGAVATAVSCQEGTIYHHFSPSVDSCSCCFLSFSVPWAWYRWYSCPT